MTKPPKLSTKSLLGAWLTEVFLAEMQIMIESGQTENLVARLADRIVQRFGEESEPIFDQLLAEFEKKAKEKDALSN